jgi:HEAT repeat protein
MVRVPPIAIVCAALALVVPLPAASAQTRRGKDISPVRPAVLRSLRALHDPEALEREDLIERIEESGPLPVDDLLRFLELGRIDAYLGMGSDFDPMDGDAQLMNRYQERMILDLLDRAGASLVDPALQRLLERSESPAALAAAILGTGAVGDATRLRSLYELALPLEDPGRVDARIERALEKGVASILQEDPAGFRVLTANWQQLPVAMVPSMVRAVGAAADGRGVELLGQVIVWLPEQAGLAVAQLRRLGPSPEPEVNQRIAAELRTRLDPLQPNLCRAAILALAELQDFHAVPQLLELLETAPPLQENALWALQRLTGRSWADSPGWWRRWYEGELAWRDSRYPRASRELRESGDDERLLSILREYGAQRLFRHDLAGEVGVLLSVSKLRAVRAAAIETLIQLESRAAVPVLVQVLDAGDEELATAALRALQLITGETHAVDSPEWGRLATL